MKQQRSQTLLVIAFEVSKFWNRDRDDRLTRQAAAQIIGNLWDIQVTHVGGAYDAYTIRDP